MTTLRTILGSTLAVGVLACGALVAFSPVVASESPAAVLVESDAVSEAKVLEDWEFTRSRTSRTCRFTNVQRVI